MNEQADKLTARERKIRAVHEFAVRSFKDHVVETKLNQGVYRHFRCGVPGSGIFAFNVVTFPGRILVAGDIGDLIVERVQDMFLWAPSAIHSIDYFAEKVPHSIPTREWDEEVADEWIDQQIESIIDSDLDCKDMNARLEQLEDCRCVLDEGRDSFVQAVYDTGQIDGCDFPDFTSFNLNFLWCREALIWFFEAHGLTKKGE